MSNLVQALQEQVSGRRAQLEEAREQIRQLREMLRPSNVTRYRELDLTGTEEAVLQIIVAAQGVCSNEMLFEGLYGSRCETSQPDPTILRIYILRLRRKLGAHGIQIDRVHGRGLFMQPDSKERLRALALDSGGGSTPLVGQSFGMRMMRPELSVSPAATSP
jgi:DNA-binding response OmpR family regulator